MNHQLDLLIRKMIINKQFTSNTNQHDVTSREKCILWKNAVCRLVRRRSAGCCPQQCLHYSRRGIAAELNLPIWTPSTPGVFMHAGKHRIGWCPSRQPLRTRCLCKYIRWVHVQRSDTKEARSCCNPALWMWLCSLSCLPSLRIEYLNSLVARSLTKKGGSFHSQGLCISYSIFWGWNRHICIALHAVHTHLASGKGKVGEREKMQDKNPHHRWAYLANTKSTVTEAHLMIFELFIYLLDHIPHQFSTGCERPTKLPRVKSGRRCVCVDSNIRLI